LATRERCGDARDCCEAHRLNASALDAGAGYDVPLILQWPAYAFCSRQQARSLWRDHSPAHQRTFLA
jgi:hypothetical protein